MVCLIKVNMEDCDDKKYERYCKLKCNVINILEKNCCIQDLKLYFERDIDSPRALNSAKTVVDIICLLEERDVLNHHNISALFYLGQFLKNETIIKFTSIYKKFFLNDNDSVCSCGVSMSYSPPTLMLNQTNVQMVNAHFTNSTNSDLHEAIRNISRRIGKQWCVLTSELGVYECQIDLVYKNYPDDIESQAYHALEYWLKNEKENATMDRLDKALNARLCKIKGIGPHLKEPIADIT